MNQKFSFLFSNKKKRFEWMGIDKEILKKIKKSFVNKKSVEIRLSKRFQREVYVVLFSCCS